MPHIFLGEDSQETKVSIQYNETIIRQLDQLDSISHQLNKVSLERSGLFFQSKAPDSARTASPSLAISEFYKISVA